MALGGPKQVEPVGPHGELIIDYSVYDALRAGFHKIVFVIRNELEAALRQTILARLPPTSKSNAPTKSWTCCRAASRSLRDAANPGAPDMPSGPRGSALGNRCW